VHKPTLEPPAPPPPPQPLAEGTLSLLHHHLLLCLLSSPIGTVKELMQALSTPLRPPVPPPRIVRFERRNGAVLAREHICFVSQQNSEGIGLLARPYPNVHRQKLYIISLCYTYSSAAGTTGRPNLIVQLEVIYRPLSSEAALRVFVDPAPSPASAHLYDIWRYASSRFPSSSSISYSVIVLPSHFVSRSVPGGDPESCERLIRATQMALEKEGIALCNAQFLGI
jgi:hypothetical protein